MDQLTQTRPRVVPAPAPVALRPAPTPLPEAADHSEFAAAALALSDGVLLALASVLGFWLAPQMAGAPIWATLGYTVAASVALVLLLGRLDLYPGFGLMRAERLRRRSLAALLWFPLAGFALLNLGLPAAPVLLAGLLFTVMAPITEDLTRQWLMEDQHWGKPALLYGPMSALPGMMVTLQQNPHLGLLAIRTLDDLAEGESCSTLVLAPGSLLPNLPGIIDVYVLERGGVLQTVSHAEHWLARLVGSISPANPALEPWKMLKRVMDIGVGSLSLLLAVPIMAVAAAFIYAADPGPVFFSQWRRGVNGKALKIWKMRSMYLHSEDRLESVLAQDIETAIEWQTTHKLKNDPRLLPRIGAFMRRFSIDELPQLWSVLKGELSLVGPRVFVDYDLDFYGPEDLRLRQSIRPGLTGLWQVAVRSEGCNQDKPDYDTAYVRSWSLWEDVDILYRTMDVVLRGRGAV